MSEELTQMVRLLLDQHKVIIDNQRNITERLENLEKNLFNASALEDKETDNLTKSELAAHLGLSGRTINRYMSNAPKISP